MGAPSAFTQAVNAANAEALRRKTDQEAADKAEAEAVRISKIPKPQQADASLYRQGKGISGAGGGSAGRAGGSGGSLPGLFGGLNTEPLGGRKTVLGA